MLSLTEANLVCNNTSISYIGYWVVFIALSRVIITDRNRMRKLFTAFIRNLFGTERFVESDIVCISATVLVWMGGSWLSQERATPKLHLKF